MENVEFSRRDISRKITIPKKLDIHLAELIGIFLGDGHIGIYPVKARHNKTYCYELNISGNMTEDIQYYTYVNRMFKEVFNVSLKIKKWEAKNTLVITLGSKAIATFFKSIGFPINNKNDNGYTPNIILDATNLEKQAFLRGIADTDFSLTFKKRKKTLHSYPVVKGKFKSKKLVLDLMKLLSELNLQFTYNEETEYDPRMGKWFTQHAIYSRGHDNFKNWMNLIGFNNPKHSTKYLIWKKYGFCPPSTSLAQRYAILSLKSNPYEAYKK
jgi:intein/homing endonuclease